ncbi:M61 family metallopeptidase [Sphingomonas piscis]|uniref:M61 family metallopeptidase n=1 Tax=Sphingomonas piscis TaxID=2714943 RepID=A0A6G7YQ00_9SPHN|nr:M61 family metallopeptidase [Sphingomonas piscis]QIK78813.1 M61 family metallopeptidase [Sphingomonas piscis]
MHTSLRAAALLFAAPLFIAAQNSAPQPLPIVDTIPAARDVPYPGTIRLDVDVTDVGRGIFKVREIIPVANAGRMTLLLPEWLPGHHDPDGLPSKVAGLEFYANGQRIPWIRDPVESFGYTIDVPAGVQSVEARFQFLSPTQPNQGRIMVTPNIVNLQWEHVSLYPAGYYTRQIPIVATLTVPQGWQAGTALRPTATEGNRITYGQVSYETLQDSPVMAGRYFRRDNLGHNVSLVTVAEDAKELVAPADVIAKHAKMVDQTIKTFGAKHFDHYDFLNAISDQLGGIGLEHHRSTEISTDPGYFTDYKGHFFDRNVFPHEFVHSWDGKFRRPADLFTPDFRMPMRNSLLWVYEGQTQFWGTVIEARSGMSSKQEVLDNLAITAANLDNLPGRTWRPLQDTVNDPIIQGRLPEPWGSYQRSEEYYTEGMLIWIEADAIIRRGTNNRRGIDDFARAFFGVRDGDWGVLPYTREDVIATFQSIYPYDWAGFFRERVDQPTQRAPLNGFTLSGYELRFTEEPTDIFKQRDKLREADSFAYSLGFSVAKEGRIGAVVWDSLAFKQGLRTGDQILAVGDRSYSADWLKDAITKGKSGTPIRMIVKRGDAVRTVELQYRGGLRYPRLVKTGAGKGPLDILLEPK